MGSRNSSFSVTHSRPGGGGGGAVAPSFEQILDAAREQRSNLIVTVAPYLDDYAQLGTASTGTNLDVLLRRRSTPLLVVREPIAQIEQCLEHVIVPLNLIGERGADALRGR